MITRFHSSPPPGRHSKGFILVATLIVIAMISLGAAYFATRVEEMQASALLLQTTAEFERDAHTSRQMVAFAAITNPRNLRGLAVAEGDLALDGRPYQIDEHTQISVQDERGLLNVNMSPEYVLRRFLASLGLPLERQSRMVDTLQDYIDIDDLKRLNGAEREDYERAGLAPPSNDYLLSHDELKQIPGWIEFFRDVQRAGGQAGVDKVLSLMVANRIGGINVNSAPREVLRAIPGLDASRLEALLDQRRIAPFSSLAQLGPFTNGALDDDNVLLVSANSWRVTHSRADLSFLLECRLVATPAASDLPVQVNQCRHRVRDTRPPAANNNDVALLVGSIAADSTGNDLRQNRNRPEREFSSQSQSNNQPTQTRVDATKLAWLTLPAARR